MILKSERCELHLNTSAQALDVLAFYKKNQQHLAPWEPQRSAEFYTLSPHLNQGRMNEIDFAEGRSMRCVLRLGGQSTVIGTCNLSNIVYGAFRACHLGYSLDADYQGQGLMAEAARLLISYAFDELNLHRVQANYVPENQRSAALLQRLGFHREGVAPAYLYINGHWRDHILTSLIRGEQRWA